ncbi:MAG: DUF4924 family protein, partial [Bacteroidota bacterium]|nr:DUF4924 family protein [Bacteroidota bacterium]
EKYVIYHFPVSELEKKKNLDWYQELIIKMEYQNIITSGHLKEVQDMVNQLTLLSEELLINDGEYLKIFNIAKSHIDAQIHLSEGEELNEIQICLNGIYGYLLMRMNDEQVDDNLMQSLNAFGDLLSYLSYMFKKINNH